MQHLVILYGIASLLIAVWKTEREIRGGFAEAWQTRVVVFGIMFALWPAVLVAWLLDRRRSS